MINDELPLLHLHVDYISQLQCINRCHLHNFDVLAQKGHTRGAGAVSIAKIEAVYAKDVIRVHLGALIEDNNDLLVEWFCLETNSDGQTNLICYNCPTLKMNTMTFDMDGVCKIQGDGIPHPAEMRSTIKIIEKFFFQECCLLLDSAPSPITETTTLHTCVSGNLCTK
jgi:hypothetical protein